MHYKSWKLFQKCKWFIYKALEPTKLTKCKTSFSSRIQRYPSLSCKCILVWRESILSIEWLMKTETKFDIFGQGRSDWGMKTEIVAAGLGALMGPEPEPASNTSCYSQHSYSWLMIHKATECPNKWDNI